MTLMILNGVIVDPYVLDYYFILFLRYSAFQKGIILHILNVISAVIVGVIKQEHPRCKLAPRF